MVGKTGVARLALTTGAPVIPVAHWGAQVILPYGSTRPHLIPRHLVRMLAGPPVDLSAYRGQPLGREVLRGATAAVMADITGLLAQLRGKEPPAVPFDPAAARRAKAAGDGQPASPGAQVEAPGAPTEAGAQAGPGGQAEPPDDPSRKAAPA
jgi:1-acyl-sn-glycerol-3-phosphate acyltransferase